MMRFQSYHFQINNDTPVFERDFYFPENLFESYTLKALKISTDYHLKVCRSRKQRAISNIPNTGF